MRPSVLATRATSPDIADRLREHFGILGMGRIGRAIARFVDDDVFAQALHRGTIAAAGRDVLEREPRVHAEMQDA